MLWRDKVEELLDTLDFSQWTEIAYQRADGLGGPRWLLLDGAPLSFDQVDYLVGRGLLIKAQKRIVDRWVMVVRRQYTGQIREAGLPSRYHSE